MVEDGDMTMSNEVNYITPKDIAYAVSRPMSDTGPVKEPCFSIGLKGEGEDLVLTFDKETLKQMLYVIFKNKDELGI